MPSSWVCVDASLLVGLVTHPERDRLRALFLKWDEEKIRRAAPALLFYEVTNVVYQYEKRGSLSASSADRFLKMANLLQIQLFNELSLHEEALRFSRQFSLSATYDAHYLALAERLQAEFWTLDSKLVNTVASELEWVRLALPKHGSAGAIP